VRTPFAKAGAAFREVRSDRLLAHTLDGLLERAGMDAEKVEDVINGTVTQAGEQGANVGRLGVLLAGFPVAAVIGLADEKWIEAVSALVLPRKNAETENLREELQEHARAKLAHFKRPKHIFFVDDLPRNAAGKILKRELRSRFADKNLH
jgi:acyl-CoA synthetase (AMP-forming)/AMP-acid ligase II